MEHANNPLTEALKILAASYKDDKAARDSMTPVQRDALAEDFAVRREFLSASHFHSDPEQRQEFERLFWENIRK